MNVNNPFKARSDGRHICQRRKTSRLAIFIITIAVLGTGLFINNYQLNILPQSEDNANKAVGSDEEGEEPQQLDSKQLNSKSVDMRAEEHISQAYPDWIDKMHTMDTLLSTASKNSKNRTSSEKMNVSVEVEQISRAYPIWIDNRRSIDSSSRPYDWCVSEDVAKNEERPKGLLFVKLFKSASSTGAGVTLRIRDGLSRRLSHANQTAPINCFAHYEHSNATKLSLQKRDASQSFLWSIVREPAQRSLSHYFFFHVSRWGRNATEANVISALRYDPLGKNYQSKYLDLPNENKLAPSTPAERIINGYDFLAVNERMDESLVVLAKLARIPLADVIVFSSKISGGYDDGGSIRGRCVKIAKKWTTPKIDKYIRGIYKSANRDDYLLYDAAQRSLDKTIDALGRQRVEENVKLLKSLRLQNEDQCASQAIYPCPAPEDERKKRLQITHKAELLFQRLRMWSCLHRCGTCGSR